MRGNKKLALYMALLFAWVVVFQNVQASQFGGMTQDDLYIFWIDARNVSHNRFEVDVVINDVAESAGVQVVIAYTTDPYFHVTQQNITGGRLAVKTHRLPEMRRTAVDGSLRTYNARVINTTPNETYYVYTMLIYNGMRSNIESTIVYTNEEYFRPLPDIKPETTAVPWPSYQPTPSPTAPTASLPPGTPRPSPSYPPPTPTPEVSPTPTPSVTPTPTPIIPPEVIIHVNQPGQSQQIINASGGYTLLPAPNFPATGSANIVSPTALTTTPHALLLVSVNNLSPAAFQLGVNVRGYSDTIHGGGTPNTPVQFSFVRDTVPFIIREKDDLSLWLEVTVGEHKWYYRIHLMLDGKQEETMIQIRKN